LIDTYDTERAARRVLTLAPRLAAQEITITGVRIDSGDLGEHARQVRRILDDGGLQSVKIVASGGLDEEALLALSRAGAPIDSCGIGTSLTTASDAPALDCAYKLQEYAGTARRKRSEGKATWPGRKQVWRRYDADGRLAGDLVSLANDRQEGETLLCPVMRGGRRLSDTPGLAAARNHAKDQLARLPAPLARLEPYHYSVEIGAALGALAAELDRREEIEGPSARGAPNLGQVLFHLSSVVPSSLPRTSGSTADGAAAGPQHARHFPEYRRRIFDKQRIATAITISSCSDANGRCSAAAISNAICCLLLFRSYSGNLDHLL
jgi:Nicotinate phosphoribosyltransferase C-terminal domain